MPGISYDSFVSSKPFIIIGPGNKVFYAHADLLAQSSAVLHRDVHGDMQEKRLETIKIQDVNGDIDDDTIARFIEYIYRADYTVPDPDIVQLQTDSVELQTAFAFRSSVTDDEWASGVSKLSKKDKHKKKKSSARAEELMIGGEAEEPMLVVEETAEALIEVDPAPILRTIASDRSQLWYSFCANARTVSQRPWKPRGNNDEREDYTRIFLCHARLYKFADRYDCAGLTALTLQKLRLTLSKYVLHDARVPDIVELVRYTYAHTMDSEHNESIPDELRVLVMDYVTCHLPQLERHPSCHQLLQEGGAFPSELFARVVQLVQ